MAVLHPPTEFPVPLDPEMVKFICFYINQEDIWGLSLGFRFWWTYATLGSSKAGLDSINLYDHLVKPTDGNNLPGDVNLVEFRNSLTLFLEFASLPIK